MKKIIELAEKVLYYAGRSLTLSFDEATEYLACRDKLKQALTERHQLEQTPITEEWLKEHGWKEVGRPYEWQEGIWVQRWNLEDWKKGRLEILDTPKYDGYTWKGIQLTSVAKLLDALDLCGIKID